MSNDMYRTLVRPILEYGGVIWSPHLKKHINKLEAVQRRATKLIPAMKYLSYKQRLTCSLWHTEGGEAISYRSTES